MTPEEQQEAIARAIQSIKDSADKQVTDRIGQQQDGQNLGQAPTPTPNPNLPDGVVKPTAPGVNPDEHPENTMQQDPSNLKNALSGKTREQQLKELMDAARQ